MRVFLLRKIRGNIETKEIDVLGSFNYHNI